MYKMGHILCDRCKTIIASGFKFSTNEPFWEIIKKVKPSGNKIRMDFCDEKCRIVFFKGRKYWRNKVKYLETNNGNDESIERN